MRYVTQGEVIEGKSCDRSYSEIAKLVGDTVCVALGCDYPLLLRSLPSGDYILVSQCFVHGLMDGEQLLGSLPDFWTLRMLADADGREVPCYFHGETKKLTRNDPRLPSLSSEWERVQRRRTQDDPSFFQDYRNKTTGEILNFDPRLTPEALKQRGVSLKTFRLI